MKLKLPEGCRDLNLTDKEKVLANLMQLIVWNDKHDNWDKTEYFFSRTDIGKIVRTQGLYKSTLSEVFKIGRYNDLTMSLKFIKPIKNSLGWPAYYEDEITDISAIKLHMYILGRFSYPKDIMSEFKGLLDKEEPTKNTYAIHYLRGQI